MERMSSAKLLFALIALVVVIWIGTPLAIVSAIPGWAERGQFGDLFGSINALFSELAFAGLFYTIYLQRQKLALQREELRLQREEMRGSREHLAAQAKAQDYLLRATVGQIKVAAIQAEMEAVKMEGEQWVPHARKVQWEQLRTLSVQIAALSHELEAGADAV
jgi:hypothetical protein